jgi:hypothetical protein
LRVEERGRKTYYIAVLLEFKISSTIAVTIAALLSFSAILSITCNTIVHLQYCCSPAILSFSTILSITYNTLLPCNTLLLQCSPPRGTLSFSCNTIVLLQYYCSPAILSYTCDTLLHVRNCRIDEKVIATSVVA